MEKEKEIKKELSQNQFRKKAVEVASIIDVGFDGLSEVYGNFKIKPKDVIEVISLFSACLMSVIFNEKELNTDLKVKMCMLLHSIFIKEGDD